MEKFYTYILVSEQSGRYYVGHTTDLVERVKRHNAGAVESTRKKGPWKVVYFEEYGSRSEAVRRELEIKGKKSRKYIEDLIENRNW